MLPEEMHAGSARHPSQTKRKGAGWGRGETEVGGNRGKERERCWPLLACDALRRLDDSFPACTFLLVCCCCNIHFIFSGDQLKHNTQFHSLGSAGGDDCGGVFLYETNCVPDRTLNYA